MKALALSLALLCATTPVHAQHWSRSWSAAPVMVPAPSAAHPFPDLHDRTVRQVVRISSGGSRIRLRLSNEQGMTPLRIGSVHVALAGKDGRIVPGSDHIVTFAGAQGAVMPAHAPLLSDPVALPVKPLTSVTISIHFPEAAPTPTIHMNAYATGWIAPGNQSASDALTDAMPYRQRITIAGVDVENRKQAPVIVAFGDSITDGSRSSMDGNSRWPDLLAERLQKAGRTSVGVANLGVGGNRVLQDETGLGALARFDRDALSVPGVSHIIILEGVNDIGWATREKAPLPTAADLIAGYRQMIMRAHDRGIAVILCTILPYKGAAYWSADGEAVRQKVNNWIKANREADGMIDFARVVADPVDPQRMAEKYNSGDSLHPNDAGFRSMAAEIDLRLLQ